MDIQENSNQIIKFVDDQIAKVKKEISEAIKTIRKNDPFPCPEAETKLDKNQKFLYVLRETIKKMREDEEELNNFCVHCHLYKIKKKKSFFDSDRCPNGHPLW